MENKDCGDKKDIFGPAPLFDQEVQKCPFPYYQSLRNIGAVHWDDSIKAYIVTRPDLIRKAALDHKTFSSAGNLDFGIRSSAAEEADRIRATSYVTHPLTVSIDPPEHTIYRKIMNDVLSIKRMRAFKPNAEALAAELLDQIIARGDCEFMGDYAIPYPFAVICTMMGLPPALFGKMRDWAESYTDPLMGNITPEREIECAHLCVEYHEFFADLVNKIRVDPSPIDNLITAVSLARLENGEFMSMVDTLSMIEQFVVAGAETTINALGSGMLALASRPALFDELKAEPAKIEKFVEEILRVYAPVQGLFRSVICDSELGGTSIPKGSRVMLRWGAGNTDSDFYADAENIDLTRGNLRNHMTFGYGVHHCQGAPLARIEMIATFTEVVKRLAYVEIDGAIEHVRAVAFLGLEKLPLKLCTA